MKSFDLTRVLIAVDGVSITGFQDGDAVTIVFDNDFWNKVVGADGEVARSARNDRTGKITFNVLYSSKANETFNAILARQATLEDVVGITIVDLQGGAEVEAPQCWIMKAPDITYSSDMGVQEWIFDTGQMTVEYAGINDEAG